MTGLFLVKECQGLTAEFAHVTELCKCAVRAFIMLSESYVPSVLQNKICRTLHVHFSAEYFISCKSSRDIDVAFHQFWKSNRNKCN